MEHKGTAAYITTKREVNTMTAQEVKADYPLEDRIKALTDNQLVKTINSLENFECNPHGCAHCVLFTGEVIHGCTCLLASMIEERDHRRIALYR